MCYHDVDSLLMHKFLEDQEGFYLLSYMTQIVANMHIIKELLLIMCHLAADLEQTGDYSIGTLPVCGSSYLAQKSILG